MATGFEQKYFVSDAVDEVVNSYISNQLKDEDRFYTVKTMTNLDLSE